MQQSRVRGTQFWMPDAVETLKTHKHMTESAVRRTITRRSGRSALGAGCWVEKVGTEIGF